jgi:hypothetical protein
MQTVTVDTKTVPEPGPVLHSLIANSQLLIAYRVPVQKKVTPAHVRDVMGK